MRSRGLLVSLVIVSSVAVAQSSDDWSSFPPATPAPSTPVPSTPDVPRSDTPPPSAPSKKADPDAKKRVEEKLRKLEDTPEPALAPDAGTMAKPATAQPRPSAPASAPAAPLAAADAGTPAPGDELPVLSQKERFVAGTEPHSPSTYGNALFDGPNHRVGTGVTGIGLVHVGSAELGRLGVARVSAVGEYQNQTNFPVLNATNIRSAGTFSASWVPLEYLEAFVGYSASANTNSSSSPTLIQALGDVTLGLKGSRRWAKGLYAGLELKGMSFSGVGNQDVGRYAWGIAPRLLGTYDLREPFPRVPALIHLNIGSVFDSTGALVRDHKLNPAEEFALSSNRFNRFTLGAALEVPLPIATPFLEYNLAVPYGAGELTGPDGASVAVGQAMAQTLGLGLKVTAVRDLTLWAAIDIGLSSKVARGIPATAPANFLLGATFAIDPFQRGDSRIVETVRAQKIEEKDQRPATGKAGGVVVDATTKKPVGAVIVSVAKTDLPPVATETDTGRYLTHDLAPGPVRLTAKKDGYKEGALEITIDLGKTTTADFSLEAEVRKAVFELTLTSKNKKVGGKVAFMGPQNLEVNHPDTAAAPVKAELPGGKYLLNVTSDGYLAQTREVQVGDGAQMALSFELVSQPTKKLVVVKDNKIEILQQVHFASGKAAILADSFVLLQQVVDAIIRSNIKRMRVEGHTDNQGNKAVNLRLSQERAQAVVDYLVAQGVERSRLEASGFGDTRPVAPNLTARGRELNRRVDFVILER